MSKSRIGIIAGEVSNGLSYQRVHVFLNHLKWKYDFEIMSMDQFLADRAKLHYWDAMILCHPYHGDQASLIQRAKRDFYLPVIVDLDDLTDHIPTDHYAYKEFSKNAISDIVQLADHVTVSTQYLQKTWGHLNPNIQVIENAIDERRYMELIKSPRPAHSGFIVGWTGSQSHRSDLYNTGFVEGLTKVMEKYDDIKAHFHLLCPQILLDRFGCRVQFDPIPVDFLDYAARSCLYPFDLCAVPLYDHPFNHAKSDLKLLEMSPYKIPVLASPVDNFARHIDKNIVSYAKDGQWFEALELAYLQRKELEAQADRAHEYVMNHRTALQGAADWKMLLDKVLIPRRPQQMDHAALQVLTTDQAT